MSVDRRGFLKLAGTAGAATLLGPQSAQASSAKPVSEDVMGVLVDIPKCIGCRRCEYACKEAAQKAAERRAERLIEEKAKRKGVSKDAVSVPLSARDSLKQAERFKPSPMETFEDKSVFDKEGLRRPEPQAYTRISRFSNPNAAGNPVYVKYNCLHCNTPACVSACLVGAFQKLEDGPVVYDAWKCMGCRYCMVACPFGIPMYEYDNALTPQVRKCTLCADEDNPYKGKVPACVKICPAEVMTYDKRSNLVELAHEKIRKQPDVYADTVYGEYEVGGTSWLYLAPKNMAFTDLGFLDLPHDAPPLRTERIQHGVFKYFVPPLAWYGLLGAAMWVSQPEHKDDGHGAGEGHH